MKEYKFKHGCMWEGGPFFISVESEITDTDGGEMCKHCHSRKVTIETTAYGLKYKKVKWICPRVVIASNEGGHNTTGVCLDCILEAAKTLPK